ncbi:MAG: GTP-binding protein, partial [Desulfobacterales bacterium]
MSQPKKPDPARLIVSILTREKEMFPRVLNQLQELFGPVEHQSGWLDFDFTTYYEKEMGAPLFRQLLAFENLIEQEDLAGIKLATNSIEKEYETSG